MANCVKTWKGLVTQMLLILPLKYLHQIFNMEQSTEHPLALCLSGIIIQTIPNVFACVRTDCAKRTGKGDREVQTTLWSLAWSNGWPINPIAFVLLTLHCPSWVFRPTDHRATDLKPDISSLSTWKHSSRQFKSAQQIHNENDTLSTLSNVLQVKYRTE